MSNDPKSLASRWFHEVWNLHRKETIYELMAPDAHASLEAGEITGPDELIAVLFEPMLAQFPDIQLKVNAMIGEGDDVASCWTASATGSDGLPFSFDGMTWMTFKDGIMVSGSDRFNLTGIFHYLNTGEQCTTVRQLAVA